MINYIYCKSFQAFFMALILRKKGEQVIVLTPTADIIKTCELLNIKYISFVHMDPFKISANPASAKEKISEICKITAGGIMSFSHTQFDVFCFLLMQELSRRGEKVCFYNFEVVYHKLEKIIWSVKYLRYAIARRKINAYFNSSVMLKNFGSNIMFGIDDSYFVKNKIHLIDNKNTYNKEVFEAVCDTQINIKPVKNLLLHQKVNAGHIEEKSLQKLDSFLRSKDLMIKYHPYFNEQDIYPEFEKVPEYIPSELIFSNIKNAVLSLHSSALITASRYKNIKAVSLLNMLTITDTKLNKIIIDDLRSKSNDRILFPESYEQLDQILSDK